MLSRPFARLLVAVVATAVLCTACWTDLATKPYPTDLDVVVSVERWRPAAADALRDRGLNLDAQLRYISPSLYPCSAGGSTAKLLNVN